jgi:glycosyltransferase involved in cell wall biosynthesis
MKIGFDAKRFFNNFTGLGNYSRFIIGSLSEYLPENKYWLYSPKIKNHPELTSIVARSNINVITSPSVYNFFHASSLWRTWGLSFEPSVKNLDLYHGLSQELPLNLARTIKKVVTVHDLIFYRSPELYNPVDVTIYKAKVKRACLQADKIIAVSHQTAEDIISFLKVKREKVEVVYMGCHPNFKKKCSVEDINKARAKYNLPVQYILNVGTIEQRKNVVVLVKALALIPKELRMQVVIVGRPTSYKKQVVEEAHRLGVEKWISFLHNIPFADLPAIYQGAQIFVYPSIFEGFGIPLVEALESSVPVITSTGSCFKEAAGAGSIYVDSNSEEELAFQLKWVLEDETLRKQMVIAGKEHITQFEPNVIAGNLNSIYKNV